MANDVILDLGNEYIGSAYSPVVEITENADGHTISITSADPDAAGHLVTQSFDVPNYADEEAGREAAEAARQAQEAQRIAAEDAREASESARQAAESSRASAETSRAVAESERQGQEQGRQQAEQYRQLNETNRQQEERARQDAEAARYNAEQARAAAETARDAAESERQLAEQAREDAEEARQAAEQARETASATAVANAEAATAAANTATQQAQAATTAANDAAAVATTAAGTANTAAAAADEAREGIQDDLAEMRSDIADKAFVDAYVPDLTAGAALGITGNGPTDSAAWLQRVSTSDGPTTIKSIHGRTLAWNQLSNNDGTTDTLAGVTTTYNGDGTWTFAGEATENGARYITKTITLVIGHKYLVKGCPDGGGSSTYSLGINGLATDVGAGGIWEASVDSGQLRASVKSGVDFGSTGMKWTPQLFDLTAMFGVGSEPSTVAEFESLYPESYYPYDAGSLLPVNMTGIESTGFNQWDEVWEAGGIAYADGTKTSTTGYYRSKNNIPVLPNTTYYIKCPKNMRVFFYDAAGNYISNDYYKDTTFTTPSGVAYMLFRNESSGVWTPYDHDICINISDPTRNGEYEPYRKAERTIPAITLRGAGSKYDALYEDRAEIVVGVGTIGTGDGVTFTPSGSPNAAGLYSHRLDYTTAAWTETGFGAFEETAQGHFAMHVESTLGVSEPVAFASATHEGIALSPTNRVVYYRSKATLTESQLYELIGQGTNSVVYGSLATPTVTPYDPPLNLTYRTAAGGTERVMVPTGENSAPPTIVAAQGYTAESLRDAALSAIAPVENGTASTNYGVGSYLVHDGQLCKVTTAIATGEAISIGTNVTATTVMAEILSLVQ